MNFSVLQYNLVVYLAGIPASIQGPDTCQFTSLVHDDRLISSLRGYVVGRTPRDLPVAPLPKLTSDIIGVTSGHLTAAASPPDLASHGAIHHPNALARSSRQSLYLFAALSMSVCSCDESKRTKK
jgi:hypothetical protein